MVAIIEDITRQIKINKALQESEVRLEHCRRIAYGYAFFMRSGVRVELIFIGANPAADAILGC